MRHSGIGRMIQPIGQLERRMQACSREATVAIKQWVGLFSLLAILSSGLRAESGVSDTEILIGQSAAFSGPAEQLGKQMAAGAKVYFDHVNQNGGIHGRKIRLLSLDDGYEPDRAKANTLKLINAEKVFALFGYVGTPTSLAALPIFTEEKVPFFGAFTGAQALREPFNRYIFNVRAGYNEETEEIVNQLLTLSLKRIAVFYQNDAYGQAGLKGVTEALARRKLAPVVTGTVERNSTDVAAAVKAIGPVKADAVIMVSAYKSVSAFVKAMKREGFNTQFHNVSFVGSMALAKELGADGSGVAVAQVMPFPWRGTLRIVRDYQEMMKKAGKDNIDFVSLEGYVAAQVLVEGLRRTGKDLTRDKLISGLESMSKTDVGGFAINFSKTSHNASSFVDLTIIGKNGKFFR